MAVALVGASALGATASAEPAARTTGTAAPAYLTLMFGRTQWAPADACEPVDGAVTLDQVAQQLQTLGMAGVGDVVVSDIGATTQPCLHGTQLYPTWAQLSDLQSTYGWNFVSGGATHGNITKMSPSKQYAESCGSLTTLASHGFTRAWGLFAYPDNHFNTTVQQNVVSTCFAYGRTYNRHVNVQADMAAPWFQGTLSVNGGACNDPSLSCYSATGQRYMNPAALVRAVKPKSGEWSVLQTYRFVTGADTTAKTGPTWDCTSSNWEDHWTSQDELYCWNDYLTALDAIPAGVTVTDPATVATAWGRIPAGS